jgi:hypothetical protein
MADITFNIAKGRVVELYNRVESNDPTEAALIVVPVDVAAVTDATIQDFDTLAAVLAGGVTERTTGGWNRKVLTDAELAALPAPDDTNNRYDLDLPDFTWTAVSTGAVTDLLVCYRPTNASADSAITPLTMHDFTITPDGSDVVATTTVFFRAN